MIGRSLRTRILVATSVVVIALAAVVGLFSSITAKRQFDRVMVLEKRRPADDRGLATRIEQSYRATHSWKAIESLDRRVIVLDPAGRTIAHHPHELDSYAVRARPDGIELTRIIGGRTEALMIRGGRRMSEADGRAIGTLFFLPREDESRVEFSSHLDRLLLGGIALAIVAFMLIVATIARRIFAPVEALTTGVRSLGEGRLDARVPVTGDDEIAALARAFNGMAEALERNETARRNMVADVAHELRTPLTNVRCQLEAVQDGLAIADRALVDSIAEEVSTLTRLVDDLQQLSLAEAGVLRLERQQAPVETIVTRAVGTANVNMLIEPLVVYADPLRAAQILRNLIVNATAHAHSRIDLRVERRSPFAAFIIEDDGVGIPPEHLDRIFDRFHRADPSRSRTTGGAGLGLAIARELTQLHGGTIAAENREAGGARFTFTLPLFIASS
jgi:signal transduction histidine kinase